MHTHHYLACDLGASSGRVILGTLADGRVALEELHRFPNGALPLRGTLRWDIFRIFAELKTGLARAAERGVKIASLSVDTWGVDYVWLNENEPLLALPFQYRDARTDRTFPLAMEKAGAEKIFAATGIQFMPLNTLYQLIDDVERRPEVLAAATQFLCIADYLNYLFSGVARAEESLASTTQIYDPKARAWSAELQRIFEIPARLFPLVVPSGTVLGPLAPEIVEETKLEGVQVVATCSHDTGAAVAAVPSADADSAYLSSGTWSLMGVELDAPLINDAVRAANFTNEVGFGGTIRFLKNISGLWLLQECKREWDAQGLGYSFGDLTRLAMEAEPLRSLVDPNESEFAKPGNMPGKIADFCRAHGESVPETVGQTVRCILESLALIYRQTHETLQTLTGRQLRKLHIVGGGCQSTLLNQATADALGIPVFAGPIEATAIGNLLVQAIALGHLDSLAALRRVVRDSFPLQEFTPNPSPAWEDAFARFTRF